MSPYVILLICLAFVLSVVVGVWIITLKKQTDRHKKTESALTKRLAHMEEVAEKRMRELGERVKELNCLYAISRLVQNVQLSENDLFREIVGIIPPSWQYPEIARARIVFEDREFGSPDFRETEWRQACDIIVGGQRHGMVEVCYLEERPDHDEGPFLAEERTLITSIARRLGEAVEFKRTENAWKDAKDAAEAANLAKTAFLAHMSHELRTPLNSILGFAQILNNDPTISVRQRENTEIMLQSGEHLLNLVNDILEIYKIESGHITLNESAFDLAELLNTVEKMIGLRLENKNVRLIVQASPNLPSAIKTDKGKLRQILINLLGNAVKFTKKGNIFVRVGRMGKTRHIDDSGQIRIFFEIEDTGVGIPPEDRESIFEAFGQSRDFRRNLGGTGLGLTISRQFVGLMGGDILVTSHVGVGTTFRFDILATPVEESVRRDRKSGPFILAPDSHPLRILIVEDEQYNCMMLESLLGNAGFEVKTAHNGENAIEMFQACAPDLILMDLGLPDMDGVEVTKRIREMETRHGENPEHHLRSPTPIIALTGNSFDDAKNAALAAGCDAFLPKPFLVNQMFELIRKYLGVRYINEKPGPLETTRMSHEEILMEIAGLPFDLVARIKNDVTEGNRRRIMDHIDDIRHLNPDLADILEKMAKQFEYKKLLSWISDSVNGRNKDE